MKKKLRVIVVLALILTLWFTYRVFAVYTIRNGECLPKPVDPSLRLLTRDEQGQLVSYPERVGYPQQTKPLLVMTYNIAGHDQLYDRRPDPGQQQLLHEHDRPDSGRSLDHQVG